MQLRMIANNKNQLVIFIHKKLPKMEMEQKKPLRAEKILHGRPFNHCRTVDIIHSFSIVI